MTRLLKRIRKKAGGKVVSDLSPPPYRGHPGSRTEGSSHFTGRREGDAGSPVEPREEELTDICIGRMARMLTTGRAPG